MTGVIQISIIYSISRVPPRAPSFLHPLHRHVPRTYRTRTAHVAHGLLRLGFVCPPQRSHSHASKDSPSRSQQHPELTSFRYTVTDGRRSGPCMETTMARDSAKSALASAPLALRPIHEATKSARMLVCSHLAAPSTSYSARIRQRHPSMPCFPRLRASAPSRAPIPRACTSGAARCRIRIASLFHQSPDVRLPPL
jgi:hypothetical protein